MEREEEIEWYEEGKNLLRQQIHQDNVMKLSESGTAKAGITVLRQEVGGKRNEICQELLESRNQSLYEVLYKIGFVAMTKSQ